MTNFTVGAVVGVLAFIAGALTLFLTGLYCIGAVMLPEDDSDSLAHG